MSGRRVEQRREKHLKKMRRQKYKTQILYMAAEAAMCRSYRATDETRAAFATMTPRQAIQAAKELRTWKPKAE